MIGLNTEFDKATVASINASLASMSENFGKCARVAPRLVGAEICVSLRAKTKGHSPKPKGQEPRAKRSELKTELSPNAPRYITYKNGKPLPIGLHRWRLTRKVGTPAQYSKDWFVYSHIKHTRKGGFATDLSAERKELVFQHAKIYRAGLAKRSWNWIRADILNGGKSGDSWIPLKREKRNPRKSADGSYTKKTNGAEAIIDNRLDYIESALKPMAIDQATKAFISRLAFKSAKAFGDTPEEAAKRAEEYARDWEANARAMAAK